MPEAAVNEHDHTLAREREVTPSPRHTGHRLIDPVPQPSGVEDPAQRELGGSIPSTLPRHPQRGLFIRGGP
jgi:hypothetical protein